MGDEGKDSCRITATVTRSQADTLKRLADANGVTLSWLVRRAVDRLIEQAEGGPLLPLDIR
jgi:hypothetical protein